MSCCSNCGGCGCSACAYVVNLPEDSTPSFVFANINVGGVGVLNGVTGDVNVNFRGVGSANAMLTVTLDAGNNVILLTVSAAAIAAAFPAATTAQAGILETATDAEAIAKAATDKLLTPSNLAALGSSTTFAGLVELATNAETQTGTSTTLAVTPAGLASVITTLEQTVTFADAVARAALAPTFDGQFGGQLDTNQAFISTGIVAGNWTPILTAGATQTWTTATTLTLTGVAFTWAGNGTLNISLDTFNVSSAVTNFTGAAVNSQTVWQHEGNFGLFNGGLDFDTMLVSFNGISTPNAVMISNAGNLLTSKLINTFISNSNTQIGYTNFTNPAVLRTCDTATVTLPQLAQIVGTLINDLKAILLPAT